MYTPRSNLTCCFHPCQHEIEHVQLSNLERQNIIRQSSNWLGAPLPYLAKTEVESIVVSPTYQPHMVAAWQSWTSDGIHHRPKLPSNQSSSINPYQMTSHPGDSLPRISNFFFHIDHGPPSTVLVKRRSRFRFSQRSP